MIEILSMSSCDGGDGIKITVGINGEKNTYKVFSEFYFENQIKKGEIFEEDLNSISENANFYAANRAAIRIISNGQCSEKKLYEKLRLRGFTHECAKNASKNAAEKGYINEDWQIENYIKTLVEKKHFGRRKIIPTLLAKGYKGDRINQILDENYSDEDFKKYRAEFLEDKFGKLKPDTSEEALEMKKALYKQGY